MNVIPIPEAAAKYSMDVKRLRGAVWRNRLTDPLGDVEADLVQDDELLERYARQAVLAGGGHE